LISVGSVVQVHPDPPFWIPVTGYVQTMDICSWFSAGPGFRRGHSSAGRAPALHAGGREFDPPWLHHTENLKPELISNRQFRFQVLHPEHCFPDGSLTIRDILKLGAKQNRVLSDQDNFSWRRDFSSGRGAAKVEKRSLLSVNEHSRPSEQRSHGEKDQARRVLSGFVS
jgi:hypothetical protein